MICIELLEVIIGLLKPTESNPALRWDFLGIQIWFRQGDARRVEESMQRAQRAMLQAMVDLERQECHELWDEGKDGKVKGDLWIQNEELGMV